MPFTILDLILTSLFIYGVYSVTREGKLLQIVSRTTTKQGENTFVLADVVSECPVCMSSLYGALSFCVLTGVVPKYDQYTLLIFVVLLSFTAVELFVAFLGFDERQEVSKAKILLVQKMSLSLYSFLLGSLIFLNGCYACVAFIVCLAGLNSLIEWGIVGVLNLKKIAANVASQTETLEACTKEISERLN